MFQSAFWKQTLSRLKPYHFSCYCTKSTTKTTPVIHTVSSSHHMFVVDNSRDSIRIDRYLRFQIPSLPHSLIERALRKNQVQLQSASSESQKVFGGTRVYPGDVITVPISWISTEFHTELQSKHQHIASKKLKLDSHPQLHSKILKQLENSILFSDQHCIVLNKPAGLAVQGGLHVGEFHLGSFLPSLMKRTESALKITKKHDGPSGGQLIKPSGDAPSGGVLVHRLDFDVSGCLIIARSKATANLLSRQFISKNIQKSYWGLVFSGVPKIHAARVKTVMDPKTGNIIAPAEFREEQAQIGKAAIQKKRNERGMETDECKVWRWS